MHQGSRHIVKAAAVAAAIAVAAFGCQSQSTGQTNNSRHGAPAHRTAAVNARPPKHVPAHVQTAEYLWSPTKRATDPSTYAPYITWAYPLYSEGSAVRAAGIKTIWYVNPVMPQRGGYEYSLLTGRYAGVQAKDCNGNTVITYNGRGLLADPRSAQAAAYYDDVIDWYIRNKIRGGPHNWDAFFIDNNGPLYGASPTPCNYDPVSWGRAFDRAIAHIDEPVVTNSLAARDEDMPKFVDRLSGSNIIGGMFEECFTSSLWTAEEDSQIQTIALLRRQHKPAGPGWWCYANNTTTPGVQAIAQRLFIYASFLLTYDPSYSLFQESFSSPPSTFSVFPETGFVPLGPATAPSNIGDLQSSGGAYVQSYRWCYYRKKLVGACEIAVNPLGGTVSVPNPQHFAHSMELSGGGVLDGGTVQFNGPAVTTLGPKNAAVLVP